MKKVSLDPLSYCAIPITMNFKETNQLLAKGTAFIYQDESKNYLITNWHNVTGLNPFTKMPLSNHGGVPDSIEIKLQIQKEPFIRWDSFQIDLYRNDKPVWFVHPEHKNDVDVVAIELIIPKEFNGILHPINKIGFDDFELAVSDDVFILGFPYSIKGGGHFPIWKRGSVATEPGIDCDNLPKLLIDTASKPGMSGSPVIFRRSGIHGLDGINLVDSTVFGQIQGFVGIYSGRLVGESDIDAQLGIVWKASVIDEIIKGRIQG